MSRHRIPLGFKLWFGFVTLVALSIMAAGIYTAFSVVSMGPEGIGRAVGEAVAGFNRAAGDR